MGTPNSRKGAAEAPDLEGARSRGCASARGDFAGPSGGQPGDCQLSFQGSKSSTSGANVCGGAPGTLTPEERVYRIVAKNVVPKRKFNRARKAA
jgi:hypothetical protein